MRTSKDVVRVAIEMAITESFEDEKKLKEKFSKKGIKSGAVNIGGNVIHSIPKVFESALLCAKRNELIPDGSHVCDGAVIGATREALNQILTKAIGLDAGGKIGIARWEEHVAVCIFVSVGLIHLDEITIGLGHRVLSK